MEHAISVAGLGKEYSVGGAELAHNSFRDLVAGVVFSPFRKYRVLGGVDKANNFWALKDVNFQIPTGQITGVIGRNGAGKSTLLKILSRITEPTIGQVRIYGRVASLLEVGSGFHPELTGRENIYMNGRILGMSRREIRSKIDDIISFAEIEKFVDTPVKRYSSGMYVRLAFSVAAHVDPDVLLVDEILAVGDAEFQQRCIGKLSDVGKDGRTVLFVSHNLDLVKQLCSHTVYLKDGSVGCYGKTEDAIGEYLSGGYVGESEWRAENANLQISKVQLDNLTRPDSPAPLFSDQLQVSICFKPVEMDKHFSVAVRVSDRSGNILFTSMDTDSTVRNTVIGKEYKSKCRLPKQLLRPGDYNLTVLLQNKRQQHYSVREEAGFIFSVTDIDCPINPARIGVVSPVCDWSVELSSDRDIR